MRYIHICIYQKKKLSEGSLGVCIFKNLSYRDYLQRGVKTGIYYPYTCVVTCIRLTKIPLWPTIVAENKDFCQFYLPFWVTFPCLTSKRPSENDWLLQCQLRGRIDNSPCFHPLDYYFKQTVSLIRLRNYIILYFYHLFSSDLSKLHNKPATDEKSKYLTFFTWTHLVGPIYMK